MQSPDSFIPRKDQHRERTSQSEHNENILEASQEGSEEYVPRFKHIQEDLASLFLISVEKEELLNNPFVKDELYRAVHDDLTLNRYFSLDYMVKEKLHNDGEPLLSKKDLLSRGIRLLQNHGRIILHSYKQPELSRIKELFIISGMFTEKEIEGELQKPFLLH
jgi:hypothetical protein